MSRDTRTQLAAVAVLIAALVASGLVSVRVAASAGRHRLSYTDRAEDSDPPQVALGIAMGAFRGLFVNWLWIRAENLKQAGKYYEAIDLARTITRLQPRFPRVWAFHAWNMAYNISVATQTAEERWQWVQAGIRLLRDEGIPANPNDLLLHRELAWIFLHKVQGYSDDANPYYKRRHAEEWTIALGPPPRRSSELRTTVAAIEAHAAWLQRIADAYATLDEVFAAEPLARELVERLRQVGVEPGPAVLRMIEESRAAQRMASEIRMQPELREGSEAARALLADPAFRPAWQVLVPHIRKRLLVDVYRMEPDRMIRYTRRFGPLDWRHPATHALYWAQRGVDNALTRVDPRTRKDYDFLGADRVVLHAVQELYRSGTLQFDLLSPQYYLATTSPDYIEIYASMLEELTEREEAQFREGFGADITGRTYRYYAAGYENFLRDAISYLYRRGQREQAAALFQRLRTWEGINVNEAHKFEVEFGQSLEEFANRQIYERIESPNVALQEIAGALQGAYIEGLLAGDDDVFREQFEYARRFHQEYMDFQFRRNAVNPDTGRTEVVSRSFPQVAAQVFTLTVSALGLQEGAVLYRHAPPDLQLAVYDFLEEQVRPYIDEAASGQVPAFEQWFPPPDGLAEYRLANPRQETLDSQSELK